MNLLYHTMFVIIALQKFIKGNQCVKSGKIKISNTRSKPSGDVLKISNSEKTKNTGHISQTL